MSTSALADTSTRPRVEQVLVGFFGVMHLATGLALLFAPLWFFQNIGTFAPFNRHYAGDLGAFEVGIGAGLLLAVRDPARHRLMIGAAAAANLVHALNHAYDALISHAPLSYWLADTAPLLLLALLLVLVCVRLPAAARR